MIPHRAQLAPDVLDITKVVQKPTRLVFGSVLVRAGEENQNVVALCADLTESTQILPFKKKFPDRYVEIGVAEQNLAAVASGMAAMGKVPFIASYAMFSPGRNWEQIRTTACYNEQNVKVVGCHAGISVGPDGATHQAIEDIAIMRVIPHMTVISPCDTIEAEKATIAAASYPSPVYIRLHREKTPVMTTEGTPFAIGKAETFFDVEGALDVVVFATGPLVHNAILAAASLESKGVKVRVVNVPTIKPLDTDAILESVKIARAVVTVEEHQMHGGFGSAIAEFLASSMPVPIEFVGVKDRFGESGEPNELIEKFGMGATHIADAVIRVQGRKQ